MTLKNNLKGYWSWEEGTGTTSIDLQGDIDGTLENGLDWTSDSKLGDFALINDVSGGSGHEQHISLGQNTQELIGDGNEDFSLNLWVSPKDISTNNNNYFLGFSRDSTNGLGLWMGWDNNLQLFIRHRSGGSNVNRMSGYTMQTEEWQMITLTYEANEDEYKIYVNSDLQHTVSNSNQDSFGTGLSFFGGAFTSSTTDDAGRGRFDDYAIWKDRLLTQSDIDELWNEGDGVELDTEEVQITTQSADQITNNSARLNGELEDLAEINEVVTFFQYRETSSETWLETDGNTRTSPTTFNETISSLSPDTEYEFRSVAEWDDGNGMEQNFGDTLTFTTLEAPAENFQITIVSTNSPVNQGQTLNVVVDVENTGNDDGTQDITLRFGTQGNIVDTQNLTVNEGQTERITLSYSIPSGQSPDTYDIWVQSDDDTVTDTITVQESQVSINYIKPLEAEEFNGFTVDFEYEIDTDGTTGTAYLFINKSTSSPNSEADRTDVITTAGVHTITHTVEDVGEDFSSSNSNTYFVRYIEDEEE